MMMGLLRLRWMEGAMEMTSAAYTLMQNIEPSSDTKPHAFLPFFGRDCGNISYHAFRKS